MMGSKNRFTLKIALSYVLLAILAAIVTFYVYSEIRDYISTDTAGDNDEKLLRTNSFLTQLYEAESLSRLALQSKTRKNFTIYSKKIDTIYTDIDLLKTLTKNDQQHILLDSLKVLLEKKVANNEVLRALKAQNQTSAAISSALKEFDKIEASLGIITPEGLAPNIEELSPKAQETIRKVADYLNANIPNNDSEEQKAKKADSVIQLSKALLKEVKAENIINENSLARREISINKTDLELSQQLRTIISSFEKEMIVNTFNNNLKKEAALKRSIRLAGITALLGFLVVGIFIFVLNRDFWKANLYRQKLEKEKKYSESLLKSREQLIATVSHDLRTPLNTISGYTDLIAESGISKKQNSYITSIKSAYGYVNNLVNDLLDFSQLEAGKMTPEKISFNLSHLLKETAQNIDNNQKNDQIILSIDIDERLKNPIINDSFRIRQILTNLIGNAYKFTKKGNIAVEARLMELSDKKNTVRISVADTGIGISEEKQALIFNEFTQADSDKKYEGYGLGLTISKKLTELLDGKLDLESAPGKGSTFTLELPVVFDLLDKPISHKTTKENITNLKILVVDDDQSFLQLIGEMAKTSKMEVILLSDFNQVAKVDCPLRYDLVLTDIEMPTVTGFDILKQLKYGTHEHYVNQPILAMTGRRDLKKDLFINHGFSDLLHKPFTKTTLFNAISFAMGYKKTAENREAPQSTTKSKQIYSLETIKLFVGDDSDSINTIIHTFLEDTAVNTEQLNISVVEKNYGIINKTAHKMLPMFRQLHVYDSIEILETMEVANPQNLPEGKLETDYTFLMETINNLKIALEKRIVRHPNRSD